MKKFSSFIKKYLTQILYLILIFIILTLAGIILSKPAANTFFAAMEAKTFDVRQILIADSKKTNKDIIIVTVDDASYEYLLNHYGEWPVPREVYAQFAHYVQSQNPEVIAFDLLFVKSLRSKLFSDEKLVEVFKKYDNVYTAINFDNQAVEVRTPPILPDSLKIKLDIQSKDFNPMLFTNCRAILNDIMTATSNIGQINTPRSEDGINRTAPLIITYPEYNPILLKGNKTQYQKVDYFPYMTLKIALKYLEDKEGLKIDKLLIDNDNNIVLGSRKLPMTPNGEVVLNWYGESGIRKNKTFTYVPFWKVLESMNAMKQGKPQMIPSDLFKGKVVYMGTSVVSLSDIKGVPTEKYLPGVELHATLLNNILDNNLIKIIPPYYNVIITIVLAVIVGILVLFTSSILASLVSSLGILAAYLLISIYIMQFFNIWIWVAMPVSACIFAFIVAYLIKYVIKSRDFEYTYKLATTDGLTELYNHRFFQEQMIFNIDYSKRSGNPFSLILIDIDFFKKFNDKYGHQAGDAVLKQVAQTLKKNVRSSDLVCRYGGEEMAIILRDTNNEEAIFTAQKICDAVANRTFKLGADLEKHVTISLGVSTYPHNGETPAALIEYADKGLYAAKENGRNQVGKIE